MLMPGVGKKVADCVALFSLDQVEAIPVDTHVWDIALRDYDPSLSLKGAKSITPAVYEVTHRFNCSYVLTSYRSRLLWFIWFMYL